MVTLSIWEVLLRVGLAVICGGVIGIDRGRKRRPAGFRTYMLVCVGAAMTMILGTYLSVMITTVWNPSLEVATLVTDVSRFGARNFPNVSVATRAETYVLRVRA